MQLYALAVLLGLFLLGIQVHPCLPFAQQGIRPDLVFILVLYLGTRPEIARAAGALLVTLLGYLCGAFSGGPLGLYAFVYLCFFVAVDLLKNVFDLYSIYLQILLVVVCSLLQGVLVFLLCWGFAGYSPVFEILKNILPKQLALTVAVAPVVLLFLRYMTGCLLQTTAASFFSFFFRPAPDKTVTP
jgi:rod shape-determining protein MreD